MASATRQTETVTKTVEVEEERVVLSLSESEAERLWTLLAFHAPGGRKNTNSDIMPIFRALDPLVRSNVDRASSPWTGTLGLDFSNLLEVG